MPKLKNNVNPQYRLHKQSGQAIVTIGGRDTLLGKYESPHSRQKYEQLVFEWRAAGRQFPKPRQDKTISELLVPYREHVIMYYRRHDGTPTGEDDTIRAALRPLRKLYGSMPAADFGPLQLEALREYMIHPPGGRQGLARTTANKQIGRVRAFFRWAVAKGHLTGAVLEGLRAVAPLKKGRTDARETEAVRPVPEPYIHAVIPHVSPQVAALIRLQLLTAARPGELVQLRAVDIDRSGRLWVYTPPHHKTEHCGLPREIFINAKAQAVLAPFLKPNLAAPVFSPAEAETDRRRRRHVERKTPMSCGNVPGNAHRTVPTRPPGESYTVDSYRRAIQRGCDDAFPPPEELARTEVKGKKGSRWETPAEWRARLGPDAWAKLRQWQKDHRWHPHQLRHNAATEIRREHGLDMARIILGQRSLEVAEIYAEADKAKAMRVMEAFG
jgi:integrase